MLHDVCSIPVANMCLESKENAHLSREANILELTVRRIDAVDPSRLRKHAQGSVSCSYRCQGSTLQTWTSLWRFSMAGSSHRPTTRRY